MIKTDTFNLKDDIPAGYRGGGEMEVSVENSFEEIGGYYGTPPSGAIVVSIGDDSVTVLTTVDLGQATEAWACHAVPAVISEMGILA